MKANFFLFLFVICMTTSCTEAYQLPDLDSQTTLVITGLITNEPGPYYVTVMENVSDISTGENIRRGINDARVTITDSNGNVDVLRSFFSVPFDSVLVSSGIDYFGRPFEIINYSFDIPGGNGGFVRFSGEMVKEYGIALHDFREGAYFTTSTSGVSGNTYTLKVEYAGKEYTATDHMCYGTVIDSLSLEPIGGFMYDGDDNDGGDGFLVPCLYFAEPQDEANFYLFKESFGSSYITHYLTGIPVEKNYRPAKDLVVVEILGNGDWPISVVSDRFMPPYVYQYKMSDGDFEYKKFQGTDMGFWQRWKYGGAVSVAMYCISEPVYRYYFELSRQFYEDGGAFSPSPASPPTNISGGAQGCFSAAFVSQYFLDLNNNENE